MGGLVQGSHLLGVRGAQGVRKLLTSPGSAESATCSMQHRIRMTEKWACVLIDGMNCHCAEGADLDEQAASDVP